MASTDALPIPKKGTAYRLTFPIWDADGDLVTGATGLDSEVSKDGGMFADCTNEATEIATSSGMYYLDLTSTEMNSDTVAIIIKTTSTGAKTTPIVLYPEEAGDIRTNAAQIGGTTQTGRDIGASVLLAASQHVIVDSGTVTTLTNAPSDSSGVTTLLSRLSAALTITSGKVDVNDKTGYSLSSAGVQALWDALTSALTTSGSIGKRISDYLTGDAYAILGTPAGASTAADIAAIQAQADVIAADTANIIAIVNNTPSGETTTITITDGVSPLNLCEVWISSDEAGATVTAHGWTDPNGVVVFYLTAGTYYLWKELAGYTFTNPVLIEV